MTIEISWPAAASACTVAGVLAKVVHGLLSSALERRDDRMVLSENAIGGLKRDHDVDVASLRATQKILFDKLDSVVREHHEYKLHVAETYVNREVLREQLLPINDALKEIRHDLQEERRK